MKRFVDIRGQGTGYRFCWFDTTVDQFEQHGSFSAWDTFEEFAADCRGDVERYRRLAPTWAFEPREDDIEGFYAADEERADA